MTAKIDGACARAIQRLEMVERAHARAIQAHAKAISALAAMLIEGDSEDIQNSRQRIREHAEQVLTFMPRGALARNSPRP